MSLTSNATGPAASADPVAIASKQRQYRWEEEELRTNLGEEAGRVADRAMRGGPPTGAAGDREGRDGGTGAGAGKPTAAATGEGGGGDR